MCAHAHVRVRLVCYTNTHARARAHTHTHTRARACVCIVPVPVPGESEGGEQMCRRLSGESVSPDIDSVAALSDDFDYSVINSRTKQSTLDTKLNHDTPHNKFQEKRGFDAASSSKVNSKVRHTHTHTHTHTQVK